MISKTAIGSIRELQAKGLTPTPEDIIRLNALGLKLELSKFSPEIWELPRVAFLGKLAFREPSIGHSIWIDSVSSYCDVYDLSTDLAIKSFALSRKIDDLPDYHDKNVVVNMIDSFTKKELSPFTLNQVRCALTYAIYGSDQTANEFPPACERDNNDDDVVIPYIEDDAMSVGAGVLLETLAIGLGLSVRDIIGFTISRVKALQATALARSGIDVMKSNRDDRLTDYYRTLDEIEKRLVGDCHHE